ncbi:MAG: hypothetical protein A2749_02390 [Parcubacteria group bacterium RIFCSPHIGHO2_01_FULL_45_26]|uniref:Uncharacterized protein n=1 Tax=Candidatus Yanofskybacteria bacterium RIFCSPLOWO2_02_FULL_43_10b TaxID=1802704 RepID=A0A1F8H3L9_9BACT|nr:MAG: hypothetical protein A3I92_00710 [Candidatus Yanofskybacteria bacterium RIFCSPLOWO2_02_FULL_43_10b]OHB18133.1 MAG: hypothetical protein A2749_02390 [Parcubacteria group bacterium RIFCSPHIGHO2_01_FULL_45_26]
MNKYKNILVMIVFGAMLSMPLLALALAVPGQPVPGQAVTLNEIEGLINGIARFLIVVSVIVAVIFIVYGGVRWVMAQGDPAQAKIIMKNGIIGALIILGVGVLLQTLQGVISRTFFGTFQ